MDEKAKVIFNKVCKKQQGEKPKSLFEMFFDKISEKLLYTDYYDFNNGLYVEMSQGEDGNYRDILINYLIRLKSVKIMIRRHINESKQNLFIESK
jgi:hypothetical protein